MNTMKTLDIEIKRSDNGRYRVRTSIDDHNWLPLGLTFPTLIDAREVASAIANAADANHTEIIVVES